MLETGVDVSKPDEITILRDRRNPNGVYDIIISGPHGVTLQGCGVDRDDTMDRLAKRVREMESRIVGHS